MIWLLILAAACLANVFLIPLTGLAGALLLGAAAIIIDLFWQQLRLKLMDRTGTSKLLWAVFGGILVRVATVYLFIRLADLILKKSVFNTFAIVLLTIPVWTLLNSRISKTGRTSG